MTFKPHPFKLLEISVMSAQDLAPISKSMRTYALVWVLPERKLATKVDQNSHNNPHWNEKFVFRVSNTFLDAETLTVMVEIYAAAWLRDVLIGSVRVPLSNLFPYSNTNSQMRFVALQIRRPSGRPQGILNMGVQLLDNTKRSMPLSSEVSSSGFGLDEIFDTDKNTGKSNKQNLEEKADKLRRTKSDSVSDVTSSNVSGDKGRNGSLVGSSLFKLPLIKADHQNDDKDHTANGNGSMVNGSMCSDLGPSASVVAAAIARGLIKTPANDNAARPQKGGETGNELLEEWTENDSAEALKTKLERWKTEMPPIYDRDVKKLNMRSRRRRKSGGRVCSFGDACGCEITITCGGSSRPKKHGKANK